RKAERIGRPQVDLDLFGRAFIEQERTVVGGANAPVVVAVRAHVHVALELLANIGVPAGLALLPDVRRDLEPLAAGLSCLLLLLVEPSHGRKVARAEVSG